MAIPMKRDKQKILKPKKVYNPTAADLENAKSVMFYVKQGWSLRLSARKAGFAASGAVMDWLLKTPEYQEAKKYYYINVLGDKKVNFDGIKKRSTRLHLRD
ncbi:MAG: hypothetical protein ACXVCY_04360 [Pseudobdellovibrionaceae bacterium]